MIVLQRCVDGNHKAPASVGKCNLKFEFGDHLAVKMAACGSVDGKCGSPMSFEMAICKRSGE